MPKRILIVMLLIAGAVVYGGEVELKLPAAAAVSTTLPADGGSWRQAGVIPLAYVAACQNMDLALRRQGWRSMRVVEYDSLNWRKLEIWEKDDQYIMVHLWRQSVDETGFSWGVIEKQRSG